MASPRPLHGYEPQQEARAALRLVQAIQPPPVRWWSIAEWAAPVVLVCLVAFAACQTTGRLAPAVWMGAGLAVALIVIRPVTGRRLDRRRG